MESQASASSSNKSLPHVIFCGVAFILFLAAIRLDSVDRSGGFIALKNICLYIYLYCLAIYAVVVGVVVLVMRKLAGKWRFGPAYLLSVILTPLVIYLGMGLLELVR